MPNQIKPKETQSIFAKKKKKQEDSDEEQPAAVLDKKETTFSQEDLQKRLAGLLRKEIKMLGIRKN